MTLIVGILILNVVIVIVEYFLIKEYNAKHTKKISYYFLISSILVWLLVLTGSFTTIKANEVGIIFDELNGGILEETYGEGFIMKSPFRKVYPVSTKNQTAFLEVNAQTKDSIYALYEITITYKVEKENAGKFYRISGDAKVSSEILNTSIKEAIQGVSTKHDIFNIMGEGLEDIRQETFESLSNILATRYHLTLVSLSIDDVDGGATIEAIIQEEAEAIQKIEIAKQEKQRAEIEASTLLLKAENEAKITLLKANANAEAQAILNSVAVTAIQDMYISQFRDNALDKEEFELNGTGGYLTIIEISEIVLKQLYYDVWDGKLPTVVTDGNGGIIIQP